MTNSKSYKPNKVISSIFIKLFQKKGFSVYKFTFFLIITSSLIFIFIFSVMWTITEKNRVQKEIKLLKEEKIELQKEKLKEEVQDLISYLEFIQKDSIKQTEQQLKDRALLYFESIRFGNDGYVFVNTYSGDALLFNGKKLKVPVKMTDLKYPSGIDFYKTEMDLAKLPGGGSFQYDFMKLNDTILYPKISYVIGFNQWEWILGAGDYLDKLDHEINILEQNLKSNLIKSIVLTFIAFIPLLLLLIFISNYLAKLLQYQFDKFLAIIKNYQLGDKNPQPFNEIYIRELRSIGMDILETEERVKQFGNIIDQSTNKIFIFNKTDLKFIYVNIGAINKTGYSMKELQEMSIHNLLPEINNEQFLTLVKPLNEKRVNIIFVESDIRLKNKTTYPVEIQITSSYFDKKEVYVAFLTDISERKKAAQDLLESEMRFVTFMNNTSALAWIKDENLNYVFLNQAFEKQQNIKLEDIKGKDDFAIFDKATAEQLQQNDRNVLKSNQLIETEEIVYDDKGNIYHALVNKFPIINETGKKYIGGMAFDITSHKKAEDLLRKSEAYSRALFEHAAVPIWVEDFSKVNDCFNELRAQGVTNFTEYFNNNKEEVKRISSLVDIIEINQKNVELYETDSKEELLGNLADWFNEESWVVFKDELIALAEGKRSFESEITIVTPNKELKKLIINLNVHPDYKDTLKIVFVTFIDITDRQKAIQALNESELHFRQLFEINPQPMWVFDIETFKFLDVNDAAIKKYGYTKEEFLSMTIKDIRPKEDIEQLIKDTTIESIDYKDRGVWRHLLKDGSLIWVEISASSLSFYDQPARLILVNDVTEKKLAQEELKKHRDQLEKLVTDRTDELAMSQDALLNLVDDLNLQQFELEKTNEKLAEINAEMETFTYSVSHDLKAPLRGIDGYSNLLYNNYKDKLDDEALEFLNNIKSGTHQMNLLIEDLLAYSRMERQEFESIKINLKSLVDNILRSHSNKIKDHLIKINCTFKDDFWLVTDINGLTIVLRNLLENAIKFSSNQKQPKIEIGGYEDKNKWHLFVKDNGIGFDMKYHDRIFKIFQRLHLPEEYEGTGIGLAMVYKAIHRMNGNVWAESSLNIGSCFYIDIYKNNHHEKH